MENLKIKYNILIISIMNKRNQKKSYNTPQLEHVKLDKEISLQLESPPKGPDESISIAPEYFNNIPFKI
jgi:hypothetical protein